MKSKARAAGWFVSMEYEPFDELPVDRVLDDALFRLGVTYNGKRGGSGFTFLRVATRDVDVRFGTKERARAFAAHVRARYKVRVRVFKAD